MADTAYMTSGQFESDAAGGLPAAVAGARPPSDEITSLARPRPRHETSRSRPLVWETDAEYRINILFNAPAYCFGNEVFGPGLYMLQSLRSKVFTAGRPERPASGDADAPASALDGVALLEAIVCETQTEALHAAVVASGINALRLRRRVKNPPALKNFLPRESTVVSELLRSYEEAGLSAHATLQLRDAFAALAGGRPDAERFFADGGQASEHVTATLAAQWARLCDQMAQGLKGLESETAGRLPDYYADNSATLAKMLMSVAGGAHPCIDAAGDVALPDLPQRRRAARRSLLQQVILRYRGKNSAVIAQDISATGIGLDRVPELKLDELVQVEMTGGRRLMGMVVWIRGASAGIKLGKPLPPNDPLLGG
jgi:hypothetical protein